MREGLPEMFSHGPLSCNPASAFNPASACDQRSFKTGEATAVALHARRYPTDTGLSNAFRQTPQSTQINPSDVVRWTTYTQVYPQRTSVAI